MDKKYSANTIAGREFLSLKDRSKTPNSGVLIRKSEVVAVSPMEEDGRQVVYLQLTSGSVISVDDADSVNTISAWLSSKVKD